MKIAYLDCCSGISGDMALGALLDLGLPRKLLTQELNRLPLGAYTIHITSEQRMGITGRRFQVQVPAAHHHRTFAEITRLITKSSLNQWVKEMSLEVFEKLARAEARIHRQKVREVHFHEVGAVDSLIDIVGTMVGIHYFQIDQVFASTLPFGSGFTESQHGTLPLPAPATLELLKGIPVYGISADKELVTPTGAALLATLTTHYGPIPPMKIIRTGYGVGSMHLQQRPNVLRLILGESDTNQETDQVAVLEANIDDMIPEMYEYLMEQLFEQGALDVSFSPLQMKKNRPGVLIRVICHPEMTAPLTSLIFKESTTAGIRYHYAHRIKLPREIRKITTPYGKVKVKVFKNAKGEWCAAPEYEECKRIARTHGIPLKTVYREITTLLPLAHTPAIRKRKKSLQ